MTQCLNDQDKWEQAVPFAAQMFEIINSDEVSPVLVEYYCDWGANQLMVLQRYAEARQPLIDALKLLEARVPGAHVHKKAVLTNLVEVSDALQQPEEAARWRRQELAEAREMANAARAGTLNPLATTMPFR